jgi:hypothetical protein
MSRIRLVRGTAGGLTLCVAALGAIAFTACSSNNSTPPNPTTDGGAERANLVGYLSRTARSA